MARSIRSLINEAETKRAMWVNIANDPEALADRGRTKEEALKLADYFEGRFDGLCNARDLLS